MLEIRPTCENCNKLLNPDSKEAMICTYECTFCADCVDTILHNVCPNCGGGFERRPIRPKDRLVNDKPSKKIIHKPVVRHEFEPILKKLEKIEPHRR